MEWFRFWHGALSNPKVQRLSPTLFKCWVNCLTMASSQEMRGSLPGIAEVAYHFRMSEERASLALDELVAARLLDRLPDGIVLHNWNKWQRESDDVNLRVTRHRRYRNVTVPIQNVPDTETDKDTETEEETEQTKTRESCRSLALYESRIRPIHSAALIQELVESEDEYTFEWVEAAFDEAEVQNKMKWSYIRAILQTWKSEGRISSKRGGSEWTDESMQEWADRTVREFS